MTVVRVPRRRTSVLVLDCGCWVEATDEALEVFADDFALDPEDVVSRIKAQHEHQHPPRELRVDIEVHPDPEPAIDGVWPDRDRHLRRTSLVVARGVPVPLRLATQSERN